MENALAPFAPYAYAIMRIILGLRSFLTPGKNFLAGSGVNQFRSVPCSVSQE